MLLKAIININPRTSFPFQVGEKIVIPLPMWHSVNENSVSFHMLQRLQGREMGLEGLCEV